MENVVKFTLRPSGPDPQRERILAMRDVQLSLAHNAKTLISSLGTLSETLRKADGLICSVNDAEVRRRLRLTSESIQSEILDALKRVVELTAACQETNG